MKIKIRKADQKSSIEEKYYKLLRIIRIGGYFVAYYLGMLTIRKFGLDFRYANLIFDNWGFIVAGLPFVWPIINKLILKKLENGK